MQSIETHKKAPQVNLTADNLIKLHKDLITMVLDCLAPRGLMHLDFTNKTFSNILSEDSFIWRKFGPKEKIKDLKSLLLEIKKLLFFVYEEDGKNEEAEEDVEKKLEMEESKKTMLETILKVGDSISMYAFWLGMISVEEKNGNKAIKYFEISHNFGFNGGKHGIANIYAYGMCGFAINEEKAIAYYKQSADLGCFTSNYSLGSIYYKSENYQEALHHFNIAANFNHARANYYLAKVYLKGEGVKVDYEKAFEYAAKALTNHEDDKKFEEALNKLIKKLEKKLKKEKEQAEARDQSILPLDASELEKNTVAIRPAAAIPTERSITAAKSLKNNDQSLN